MTEQRQAHWDSVYGSKAEEAVSWFQAEAATSRMLLARLALTPPVSVVDVGGGASRLVDELLTDGGFAVTVLDVAAEGLAHAQRRLGRRAAEVEWVAADVTRWRPTHRHDVWHDRAVFHFLTDAGDRARYREVLHAALSPGGAAVVATFAPDGPEQCSGLPVRRYDADALQAELAPGWQRVADHRQVHVTPWGVEQPFTWLALRRPEP